MDIFEDEETLLNKAQEKIELGQRLLKDLQECRQIAGVDKVCRNIQSEMKTLTKAIQRSTLKKSHVECSNLTHYEFLVKILQLQSGVLHVDCAFPMEERTNPIRVDIVSDEGRKWCKVIARNAKSLMDAFKGEASYGARSIIDQADDFVKAARQHLCMFEPPKVVFYFMQKLDPELEEQLAAAGVTIAYLELGIEARPLHSMTAASNVGVLNLDVTTLLAYVSNMCNDSCYWTFKEPLLTEQAEKERQEPLKPMLDKLFEGKRLICCEVAHEAFQNIISVLAGPLETARADALMERVEIMPDVTEVPKEFQHIKETAKINQRSLKIFAFGMEQKALTVTSNKAFVRAAKMQGISVPVFIHQARALTESKEDQATPLAVGGKGNGATDAKG